MVGRAILAGALALLVVPRPAAAGERRFELGAGLGLDALGAYDVGEALGGPSVRDDLGPATFGFFFQGAVLVTSALSVGADATIAFGGLVRTDERYFGEHSATGSTVTASARGRLGWRPVVRPGLEAWVGVSAGMERMSEATGLGSVKLDSVVVGPWVGVALGAGFVVQLAAELHVPVHGEIGDEAGDPTGAFVSGGIRLAWLYGFGRR